mmetsp:Transcript_10569/g.28064  ORF Transcript_10569/g.28064 Transcript_10569/m.28064 type:complete len:360 (+) Transcript_10569:2326-3405(+)
MVHQRSKIAAKDNLLARSFHQHKYESAEDLSRVREKIRRAMLHASRDVQIVLGQVIDEFAGTRNLVKACDATIKGAVEVLSPLYEAIWSLIIFTESAGFESYEIEVAGLRATCEQEHHLQRTRAKDLIVLIDDAAIAKVKIDPLMERIRDIAVCKAVVPEGLKPLDRVIERAMMDPLNNLTNTADMVRYRFVGANMKRIAVVLAEFHKSPDLRIVDVIDGFAHCEGIEGWRSCTIYFSHNSDRHQHICEAQICHAKLVGFGLITRPPSPNQPPNLNSTLRTHLARPRSGTGDPAGLVRRVLPGKRQALTRKGANARSGRLVAVERRTTTDRLKTSTRSCAAPRKCWRGSECRSTTASGS